VVVIVAVRVIMRVVQVTHVMPSLWEGDLSGRVDACRRRGRCRPNLTNPGERQVTRRHQHAYMRMAA
jgi:hypothetical protein